MPKMKIISVSPEERSFRRLPAHIRADIIHRAQCLGVDYISLYQSEQLQSLDKTYSVGLSFSQNLDNCTDAMQSALEGGNPVAYERTRVLMGIDSNNNPIYKQISGKTQDQRNDNIVQAYISSGRIWEFMSGINPVMQIAETTKHPFNDYALAWYNRFKMHLRSTTAITQKGWRDEVCRFFGDMPIENISVDNVQDYINSIQKNTSGTIDQKLTFLGEILNAACEDGLIEKNPTKSSRIRLGGQQSKGIEALSKETIKELIEKIRSASDIQIKFYLALMLYSGMRREEMLGLRWEDIDFEKCIIHVERTITYPSSKPVIGLPKTPKSERDVPVPDELIDILRPHKKPEGFLMSNENGELYNDYQIKKLRSAAREYSGLPELDARQLRHSFASLLHAAGVETRAVGACMGHTKTSTTDRYIQVEDSRLNDIRNAGFDYAVT